MPYLNFYRRELKEFEHETNIILSDDEAIKVCHKIARHYKFRVRNVRFYGNMKSNRGHGSSKGYITLPHNPSLHIIIHELAHVHNGQKKNRNIHHTKSLMSTIRRFVKYCRKMNYWNFGNHQKSLNKTITL